MLSSNSTKMLSISTYVKLMFVAICMIVATVGIVAQPAQAINVFEKCTPGSAANDSAVCQAKGDDATSLIETLVNTMLFIIGSLSVIMIIVGGIRYVTYNGEASRLATAKSIITYAIVGLVVSLLAYGIVRFVVRLF